jgi:hypothetical protein
VGLTGDRTRRVTGPFLLAGAVLAASVLLHVRDPHVSGSWGFCPWLLLTGTYCPGCGGLRAVHDLTHLDLRAAASSNLLVVAGLPLAAVWWGRTVADRWRGVVRAGDGRRRLLLATLVLSLAGCFAVLRNTGAGAWLAP